MALFGLENTGLIGSNCGCQAVSSHIPADADASEGRTFTLEVLLQAAIPAAITTTLETF